MTQLADWHQRGFAAPPRQVVAKGAGTIVYRAWGGTSSEWGSGYFSPDRPATVSDAELRFNLVLESGNAVTFVPSFRIRPGVAYWLAPIAHGPRDICRSARQIYVPAPLPGKVELLASRLPLARDRVVHLPGKHGNC